MDHKKLWFNTPATRCTIIFFIKLFILSSKLFGIEAQLPIGFFFINNLTSASTLSNSVQLQTDFDGL